MAKILVIEDDRFVRTLLELHLRNAGHEVVLAEDPVEGLKSVLRSLPELILLDVRMPYMSGLDVLKALKSDEMSRHIPVLMLTGETDPDTWAEAAKNGANAFLNKPIRIEELLGAMNELLPPKT